MLLRKRRYAISSVATALVASVVIIISAGVGIYEANLAVDLTRTASNVLVLTTATQSSFNITTWYTAANQTLIVLNSSNGSLACRSIAEGQNYSASWSGNVCTLTGSYYISSDALEPYVTLEILPGVTLVMNGAGFGNYGTIINNGTMDVETFLTSFGVIDNFGLISTNVSLGTAVDYYFMPNGGTFDNYGAFLINGDFIGYYQHDESYLNGTAYTTYITAGEENLTGGQFDNGAILDNYGIINNTGSVWNGVSGSNFNSTINNYGTIRNLKYAEFVNDYTINNNDNGTIVNSGSFANDGIICGSNLVESSASAYSGRAIMEACSTASP